MTALLTENGFNVVIADYPHCGRNQPLVSKDIDYGYADLLSDFIPQLEQISLETCHQKPILFGHSLGGHLATLYAQHHDNKVIGIATGNIGLKKLGCERQIQYFKSYGSDQCDDFKRWLFCRL
ncbi:alpha/beta hydrolase [Acinetobacter wuhouensis]|uniref:alpha/beta hydrolase n=1 Tax=Acinetobacter wuhouensis TaxID=1879050 RepID=UPI000B019FA7|nr:alpha/beta fold hydrolase [Acinetobacter wuhouensis]